MEFHSSAFPQAEGNDSEHTRAGRLEMPEDGSTTAVSGKGLSCTVRGLKVRNRAAQSATSLPTRASCTVPELCRLIVVDSFFFFAGVSRRQSNPLRRVSSSRPVNYSSGYLFPFPLSSRSVVFSVASPDIGHVLSGMK